MLVTKNIDLVEFAKKYRNWGKFEYEVEGLNYRMNEFEAVLGITQIREIHSIIDERQRLAKLYMDFLRHIPGVAVQRILPDSTTVWQAFVLRFKDGNIDSILKSLWKMGIEANIGSYALHLLRFYQSKYGYKPSDYPNAEN